MLDRTIAPPFREIEKVEIQQAVSGKLDNGIPVHIIQAGTEPVVRLEFIFRAGHWFEPRNGVSFFATKSLSLGTASLSAKQIEEKIALYGAFLDLSSGYDRSTLTLYCLSKHVNSLLPLVREMITESTFPEEEINNLKNISLQNYKVNLNKTSFLASEAFRKLIFGDEHPYGRTLDEDAIIGTQRDELINYFGGRFNSYNLDIIVSGNAGEECFAAINNFFGESSWGKVGDNPSYTTNEFRIKEKLIEKRDSVQSSLRLGFPLFSINHPDYFKVNFLIELYGGYFGSRLMKNIREEKGYTYGIGASVYTLLNSGYVVIGTDVNKENTENTITEIYKEARLLKNELVSYQELTTLRNYLLGSFVSSLSTPFGLADKFKTIYFNGLDYSFYEKYQNILKTITAEEVLETARQYLPEEMIEVVAGGRL